MQSGNQQLIQLIVWMLPLLSRKKGLQVAPRYLESDGPEAQILVTSSSDKLYDAQREISIGVVQV